MEKQTKKQNKLKALSKNVNSVCDDLYEALQRIKMIEEEIKEHRRIITFRTAKLEEATEDLFVKKELLATKKKNRVTTVIEDVTLSLR